MYWWIVTTYQTRPVILGPFNSEEEASQSGFSKFGGNFEAFDLDTKDRSSATAKVKAIILERTSNLETALRRAKHKTPSNFQNGFEGD